MDDMSEIKSIVETLNAPPFNMKLNLAQFDSKTPMEKLQVVNDVFAELNPQMKRDIRDEPEDQRAMRMLEFVLMLNYEAPDMDAESFNAGFLQADPDVLYPFLYYILDPSRIDDLKKRAYLARYLRNVEIPEDLFSDHQLVGLFQQHKEQQGIFTEVHKQVDVKRETHNDPKVLEEEIDTLTGEREQLMNKLTRLKEKVANGAETSNVDFEDILASTHALRQQQEEESKMYQGLQEQKHALQRSQQLQGQANERLLEMEKAGLDKLEPLTVLSRTRKEVGDLRELCDEKMEKDIRAKEKELLHLDHTLTSDPMTPDEVSMLEQEITELMMSVDSLTAKRDAMTQTADKTIGFYRDRATAVEKKKERLLEQLEALEEEKAEAETDLKQIQGELKGMEVNGQKPKSDAQMKTYMRDLQKKTVVYKARKTDVQAARDEVNVLVSTEQILRSRADDLEVFNQHMEKEQGVEGARATQQNLEEVSTQKTDLDQAKAQTLDEMSRVVANITQTLKARKNKLAPQIKELRSIRHRMEDVETKYEKEKKAHDNIALGLESERLKLEQDVDTNVQGCQEEESSYHFMHCLTLLNQGRLDQVSSELAYQVGDETLSSEHKSYKDMYESLMSSQATLTKELQAERRSIQEHHEDHVQQRKMFMNLKKILEIKAKSQHQQKQQQLKEEESLMGSSDFGEVGVDRMVIGEGE